MRKIGEVLRLRFELGLGQRAIARACSISQSAVHEYLNRAAAAGVVWPLGEEWDEQRVEQALSWINAHAATIRISTPPIKSSRCTTTWELCRQIYAYSQKEQSVRARAELPSISRRSRPKSKNTQGFIEVESEQRGQRSRESVFRYTHPVRKPIQIQSERPASRDRLSRPSAPKHHVHDRQGRSRRVPERHARVPLPP